MIKLENVKKSFGKLEVLRDVTKKNKKGEVVVILGPSGSGKTTLLRSINFLEKADSGKLTLSGKEYDLRHAKKRDILEVRRKTGFVFQNYALFANKTALQNVTEGLITARKIPKVEAVKKAEEALEWVGLSDKYNAYPCCLSGGQQQRVGIARAIVLDPEVILFDEPTSALDPELVGETLHLIKKIARSGKDITMIIVTHEMNFARDIADKVIFMSNGTVIEQGGPDVIFTSPKDERTRQFLSIILPPEYTI